ncbi:MAG: TetR family transcriptional regulator [Bacteroidota bacterium]
MKQLIDTSTEEKILEAARVIFMKYGLYGARMQDIADTAGINKALLHYYFRNKEKLFDKVFEGALSKYFSVMDVFANDALPILQRLNSYIDNIIDFYSEYPQMSMFIIKEIGNNPDVLKEKIQAAKKNKTNRLIQVLEEGMKTGEVKKTDATIFHINLQSLCAYPFLASPMFRHSLKANGKDWEKDFSNDKLKKSIKAFITGTLSPE